MQTLPMQALINNSADLTSWHVGRDIAGIRVVALGGGTGLANLLTGLKQYVHPWARRLDSSPADIANLCAVVTVTDDGGSSGRLRKEFNVLPPGDIRNCIAALSEDEALLSHLFQHRFHSGGLSGHTLGNLFLTALTTITGDFAQAVRQSSEILATRGHIYPSTASDVQLEAVMADGSRVVGETNITASTGRIVEIRLNPPDPRPLPQTLDAIAKSDLIIIGPGSLFTSLIPNLLVHGIPKAIAASPAVKVLVCNLMTEANESLGLSAADHIRLLHSHARLSLIDYAIVNQAAVSSVPQAKYAVAGGSPIYVDIAEMESLGVKVISGDYLEMTQGVARHANDRLAQDLLQLCSFRKARGCRTSNVPIKVPNCGPTEKTVRFDNLPIADK